MSWFGIILVSVFSANALMTYGLGSDEALRGSARNRWASTLAVLAASVIASVLLWGVQRFVLAPLGLERFEVVAYAFVVAPLMKYLAQLVTMPTAPSIASVFSSIDETTLSSLVFGIALLATRAHFGLGDALLASLASVLGYAGATVLLDSIRRRMELSSIPRSLRSGPAVLLSAGLMAMAYSGIDGYLLSNLVK
jgi:electron transport complex protein RnfA